MKILAIRGKNIASLEGNFEVDFTAEPLASAGIFAICGPTGSGKSTLLDTLSLALFDDTPRLHLASENSIQIADVRDNTLSQKDSRCLLRRGSTEGFAQVDFLSLNGSRYRSTWSVRRARERADGKLQDVQIQLTNLTTGDPVPGKKTELLSEITGLIGLNYEQFTRAVLLAQGDFATFLKAREKEKAELLEKLTGTAVYSKISSAIYEKNKASGAHQAALQEQIDSLKLLSEEAEEALKQEKKDLGIQSQEVAKEEAQAQQQLKWLKDKELLDQKRQLAAQQLLDAQKAHANANQRRLYIEIIEKAESIRETATEYRKKKQQLKDNGQELVKKQEEARAALELFTKVEEDLQQEQKVQEQLQKEWTSLAEELKRARDKDQDLAVANTNQQNANNLFSESGKDLKNIQDSIKALDEQKKEGEKKIKDLLAWEDHYKDFKAIALDVRPICERIDSWKMNSVNEGNSQKSLDESKELLKADESTKESLEQESERLNKLLPVEVLALRSQLQPNAPCPVCGSLQHPWEGITAASLEQEKLNKQKETVGKALDKVKQNIENRLQSQNRLQATIELSHNEALKAFNTLSIQLSVMKNWKNLLEEDRLKESLQKFSDQWDKKHKELDDLHTKQMSADSQLKLLQPQAQEKTEQLKIRKEFFENALRTYKHTEQVRKALLHGDAADKVEKDFHDKENRVKKRVEQLSEQQKGYRDSVQKQKGAIEQAQKGLNELETQIEKLHQGVQEWIGLQNGLFTEDSLSEVLAHEPQWIVAERNALQQLTLAVESARSSLQERQKMIDEHLQSPHRPKEEADVTFLETKALELHKILDDGNKRIAEVDVQLEVNQKQKQQLDKILLEKKSAEEAAETWKKLNELFGSADGSKFKVLAQGYTLDVLLVYANEHLRTLAPRYTLQRAGDSLALQVRDNDLLGEVRTVLSLSGGESFLVSLALALALSSLSSNRMHIESLFIDEGFGSLDADTLSVAMDALEGLQSQGRKIGIISHVEQMTERIGTQIRVEKTSGGRSRLSIVSS